MANHTAADSYRTPLFIAAEHGFVDICQRLLRSKVSVDSSSKSGKSPLYAAAENGHVAVVSFLLSEGANVRKETCLGKIALYAAEQRRFNVETTAMFFALKNAGDPVHLPAVNVRLHAIRSAWRRVCSVATCPATSSRRRSHPDALHALSRGHLQHEHAQRHLLGLASASFVYVYVPSANAFSFQNGTLFGS